MCEVLWPHTHVMVNVPCGYSYSLSWSMYHMDFDRLGAMIKSVIFVIIRNFTQLWFMRPLEISLKIYSCWVYATTDTVMYYYSLSVMV